jgi:hypothetical protein
MRTWYLLFVLGTVITGSVKAADPQEIVGWGQDNKGQINTPSGQFQDVAAGEAHSLGLTTNGEIIGWGADSSGQASPPSGEFLSLAGGGYHGMVIVAPPGPCSWRGNYSCNTDDLDALYAVFNTSVPPTEEKFDLNSDGLVDVDDLDEWLRVAATRNGHSSPCQRGDLHLDRVVDLTEYNWLAANFSPLGYDTVTVPEPVYFWLLASRVLLLAGAGFRGPQGDFEPS